MPSKSRIRLRTRLLPVLTGALLALQYLDPFDGWRMLLVGLGAAWLLGYLWVRSLGRGLELQRERRFGWAQVGDRMEERFTLINHSLLPALWIEVVDRSTLPGYYAGRVTGIDGRGERRWHTEGECTRRGLFRLGPTILRTGDPLGLFTLELDDPGQAMVLVTPPVVPLPSIQVAPGGRSGDGSPRPDAPEQTVSAASVRAYAPGDSLRDIHWKTSAHHDSLFVRRFEGSPAGDWWILVDLDRRAQAGEGQDSTEEHSVILAASLAERGLRLKRAVGLAANSASLANSSSLANNSSLGWLLPREGDGQRWEILRALALASPIDRPLEDFLLRLKPGVARHSSLIMITANTYSAEKWLPALLPHIWVGATPTILLLDPQAFGKGAPAGPLLRRLDSLGMRNYRITPDLLDRPEARPGQAGHWDFHITASGRAVAVGRPKDLAWKKLS